MKPIWGKKPLVVGTLMNHLDWKKALKAYQKKEIDALELRLDAFSKSNLAKLYEKVSFAKKLPPLLITVRSKKEGGIRSLTDSQRKERFHLFTPFASAFDCELTSSRLLPWIKREAKLNKKDLIISYHDFKSVPGKTKLENLLKMSLSHKPTLSKFAFKINKQKDLLSLFSFLSQHQKKGLVVIGMAKKGEASRIVFPLMGSKMTFGHLGRRSAPGQLSTKALKRKIQRALS
jgi:3-dehydroquinate dehydratase-1